MAQQYGSGGTTEQVRGTVEQANEKGVKVAGRWFNFSQYSRSTIRPQEGDQVELEIARGKFINDARILGGSLEPASDGEDPFGAVDEPAAAPAPPPRVASWSAAAPAATAADRNTEIRRLALVKAAADYATTRPDLTPEDVTAIAAQWETWVLGQP
jgi:hypothetical protein